MYFNYKLYFFEICVEIQYLLILSIKNALNESVILEERK